MPVIGFLSVDTPDPSSVRMQAFHQGLSEAGFADGSNVTIEYRWAKGQADQLHTLAKDLVGRRVTVIAATSTPALLAAKAATSTIPIVCFTGIDLVQARLVASLSRPGGNLTGVTTLNVEIAPKRVELLHEVAPKAMGLALLINPTNPALAETLSEGTQVAAQNMGLELRIFRASSEQEFGPVFNTLRQQQIGAIVIGVDLFYVAKSQQLGALAARYQIPSIFITRKFVTAGGLMSYAGSIPDAFRLVGVYSGRVLKGDKPAEMPIVQATKVELIINLKAAKILGLTVPLPLLGRADEVIE